MQNFEIIPGTIKLIHFKYDENSHILDITSNCGTVYRYFEVPVKIIQDLKKSDKPDDYYKNFIRNKFKRLIKTYDYSVMF